MPEVFAVYSKIRELLSESQFTDSPEFDARLILSSICDCETAQLPLKYRETVSDDKAEAAYSLANKYLSGTPLQYLLGKWEFMSLPFFVGEGVFIPNPDTEHLAQAAIDFAKMKASPLKLLDLCAGSGCVGISAAHYAKNITSTLVELHEAAFSYLKKNVSLSGSSRCIPVLADALTFIPNEKYDIVVSNPPYISYAEYTQLPITVTAQPETALTDGGDGLLFYKCISKNALSILSDGGMLAFEIGFKQFEAVSKIMNDLGYKHVHDRRDYSGIRRVVIGYR